MKSFNQLRSNLHSIADTEHGAIHCIQNRTRRSAETVEVHDKENTEHGRCIWAKPPQRGQQRIMVLIFMR